MQIEEYALEHLATAVDAKLVMFSDLLDSLQPSRYREVTAADRPAVAAALQACLRSSNGERPHTLPSFPSILVLAPDELRPCINACPPSVPGYGTYQLLLRLCRVCT